MVDDTEFTFETEKRETVRTAIHSNGQLERVATCKLQEQRQVIARSCRMADRLGLTLNINPAI